MNQLEITRKQIEDLLKQNVGKDEIEKPLMDLNALLFGTDLGNNGWLSLMWIVALTLIGWLTARVLYERKTVRA